MLAIVMLVGFAGRFPRRWWLAATPVFVLIAIAFAFVSGYIAAGVSHPLHSAKLGADVVRIERAEHVSGTPVRVEKVSSWTDQVNAFTTGFGPSTRVVLW